MRYIFETPNVRKNTTLSLSFVLYASFMVRSLSAIANCTTLIVGSGGLGDISFFGGLTLQVGKLLAVHTSEFFLLYGPTEKFKKTASVFRLRALVNSYI